MRTEKIVGEVVEVLPNMQLKLKLEDGREMRAYIGGKMKKNSILCLIGDRVEIDNVASDFSNGRVVRRL